MVLGELNMTLDKCPVGKEYRITAVNGEGP